MLACSPKPCISSPTILRYRRPHSCARHCQHRAARRRGLPTTRHKMNYDASQKIRGKTRGLHGKYEANTRATRQCTETRTRTRTFRCLSDCTRRERMICQQNTHSTKSDGARLENTRAHQKHARYGGARSKHDRARSENTRDRADRKTRKHDSADKYEGWEASVWGCGGNTHGEQAEMRAREEAPLTRVE